MAESMTSCTVAQAREGLPIAEALVLIVSGMARHPSSPARFQGSRTSIRWKRWTTLTRRRMKVSGGMTPYSRAVGNMLRKSYNQEPVRSLAHAGESIFRSDRLWYMPEHDITSSVDIFLAAGILRPCARRHASRSRRPNGVGVPVLPRLDDGTVVTNVRSAAVNVVHLRTHDEGTSNPQGGVSYVECET